MEKVVEIKTIKNDKRLSKKYLVYCELTKQIIISKGKGKLTIKYSSLDELDGLLVHLRR